MARICGICPVSHLMASAKACDAITGGAHSRASRQAATRHEPGAGRPVARAEFLLSFLARPAAGHGCRPGSNATSSAWRRAHPTLARDGIRLRQFGQQIIEWLGGKRIHPAWVVPGGVSEPLLAAQRERILAALPDALGLIQRTLEWFKQQLERFREEIARLPTSPPLYGPGERQRRLGHYDGSLRIVDARGEIVADRLDPLRYQEYIGEAVEPWSYLKFPYYKPLAIRMASIVSVHWRG